MFVKAIFWPKGVQLSPYPHRWSTGQTAPPRPPPPPTVPASPAARLAGAAGCGRQRRRRRRASGDTALRLASEGPRAVWKVTPLGCFIWATTGGWSGRYQWSSYVGVKLWKLEILTKWQHTHTQRLDVFGRLWFGCLLRPDESYKNFTDFNPTTARPKIEELWNPKSTKPACDRRRKAPMYHNLPNFFPTQLAKSRFIRKIIQAHHLHPLLENLRHAQGREARVGANLQDPPGPWGPDQGL